MIRNRKSLNKTVKSTEQIKQSVIITSLRNFSYKVWKPLCRQKSTTSRDKLFFTKKVQWRMVSSTPRSLLSVKLYIISFGNDGLKCIT